MCNRVRAQCDEMCRPVVPAGGGLGRLQKTIVEIEKDGYTRTTIPPPLEVSAASCLLPKVAAQLPVAMPVFPIQIAELLSTPGAFDLLDVDSELVWVVPACV